jgi:hypothetical protein
MMTTTMLLVPMVVENSSISAVWIVAMRVNRPMAPKVRLRRPYRRRLCGQSVSGCYICVIYVCRKPRISLKICRITFNHISDIYSRKRPPQKMCWGP